MSLLDRMRKDAQKIMNSDKFGFGTNVILTTPDGVQYPFKCIIAVIHNTIDPDTGQPVSGYLASASINILDLNNQQLEIPEGEMSEYERPWLMTETNIYGNEVTYKVVSSNPDEAVSNILCYLGAYER